MNAVTLSHAVHSITRDITNRGLIETAGLGRGGGRRHAAREFHTFPVHDDDTEFPEDVMHDTDFSDCSEDSDSPIGT